MSAQGDFTSRKALLADRALQRTIDRLILDDEKVGVLVHLLLDPLALERQPILHRRRTRSRLLLRVEALARRPEGLVGRVYGRVEVVVALVVLVEAFERGEIDIVADSSPELVGRGRVVALGGANELVELLELVLFSADDGLGVLVVIESMRKVVLLGEGDSEVRVVLLEVARLKREFVGRRRALLLDVALALALGFGGLLALTLGAGPLRRQAVSSASGCSGSACERQRPK